MAFEINSLVTDSAKEEGGVWCALGSDAEILVAREGNQAYQDYLHNLVTANRAAIDQDDKASRELQRKLFIRAYAHHILKDVKGITRGGQLIEKYTPEIGIELLSIPDFFKKVQGYATQFNLYQKKAEDEAVKN